MLTEVNLKEHLIFRIYFIYIKHTNFNANKCPLSASSNIALTVHSTYIYFIIIKY